MEDNTRASTEAAMVVAPAALSAASCTAQRPVPFIDAESRIRSMRSPPVPDP
jgi:hypothetical protein